MHGAKEGGKDGYREGVREIKGNRERDGEWEKRNTHNSLGSINGPSIRGRVGLTLKLDELLGPSMTFKVILIKMKYLRIHNISIHMIFIKIDS